MNSWNANGRTSARSAFGRPYCTDHSEHRGALTALLATVSSDSHAWNLLYLQLLLEELGLQVVNLGICTPVDLVLASCHEIRPELLVVSSINGHGHSEGLDLLVRLRRTYPAALPTAVIGGKLALDGSARDHRQSLLDAGYDAVFDEADGVSTHQFLSGVVARLRPVPSGV